MTAALEPEEHSDTAAEEAALPHAEGGGLPSRRRHAPPPPALRLTPRDLEILRAVNRYRFLRTGQLQRLLFPEASLQATRRRLRKLCHPAYAYLGRIGRQQQVGDGGAETAFFLERAGRELLANMGETIIPYPRGGKDCPGILFLEHALELSEFRVRLELALARQAQLRLHRFVSEHELKEHVSRALRREAYRLYQRLTHPRTGREYVVFPDALFVLAGTGRLSEHRRLFFLEIDRGTERLAMIREKVIGYHLLHGSGAFRKFGDHDAFRVLLQTNSVRRAHNIRAALTGLTGEGLLWTSATQQITPNSILTGEVWQDSTGRAVSIAKPTPVAE